ncbi:unnamed protein product [Dicrocoelium dendriticum]|nr:unnamed protein product [Dicrocoelium dendriticum]
MYRNNSAQNLPRQPPVYHPDNDFEDWYWGMMNYYSGVPEQLLGPCFISYLGLEAVQLFRTMQVPVDAPFERIITALCRLFLRRNHASFLSRAKAATAIGEWNSVTSQAVSHTNLMIGTEHIALSEVDVALPMPDDLAPIYGSQDTIAILPHFVSEIEDLIVWETASSSSQVPREEAICTAVTDCTELSTPVISFATACVVQTQITSHYDEAVIFPELAYLSPSYPDIDNTCAYTVESTAKPFSPSVPSILVDISRRPPHSDSITFLQPLPHCLALFATRRTDIVTMHLLLRVVSPSITHSLTLFFEAAGPFIAFSHRMLHSALPLPILHGPGPPYRLLITCAVEAHMLAATASVLWALRTVPLGEGAV